VRRRCVTAVFGWSDVPCPGRSVPTPCRAGTTGPSALHRRTSEFASSSSSPVSGFFTLCTFIRTPTYTHTHFVRLVSRRRFFAPPNSARLLHTRGAQRIYYFFLYLYIMSVCAHLRHWYLKRTEMRVSEYAAETCLCVWVIFRCVSGSPRCTQGKI
jgi:hypothetical protein